MTRKALIAVLVLTLALVGCGGGGAATTVAVPSSKAQTRVRRCNVQEAEGAIYSTENDLRGIKENLRRALADKKTVILKPGGPARITTYSGELLHAIHRELSNVRKILRSC